MLMSKFKIGDRVSFLYFGDKKKGTILGHWPVDLRDTGTGLFRVTLDGSADSQVCVAEKTMKKLKPKKKRREFWVILNKNTSMCCLLAYHDKGSAFRSYGDDPSFELIHVKEVRR